MTLQEALSSVIDEQDGIKMTFYIEFTNKTIIDMTSAAVIAGVALILFQKLINKVF